jgi:hypothetical protein
VRFYKKTARAIPLGLRSLIEGDLSYAFSLCADDPVPMDFLGRLQ